MGLLDDAIREHLELKRRRGADPAEIERDEQEALGPVRRAPEEDENGPLEAASHADEDDYEAEEDDGWEDDPLAEDSDAFAEEPELFEDERQSRADESSPFDEDDDDPFSDEPEGRRGASPSSDPNATQIFNQEGDEPSPPPPRAASPPPRRGDRSEETAEFDVADKDDEPEEGRHADEQGATGHADEPATGEQAGKKKPDEDVLEETPEFLQDTPDHDRLWFEQRPPRDFDFDG